MSRDWRKEIEEIEGQLSRAKEYFKNAKKKYVDESVYTKRIASNGVFSLMKTDASFVRMVSKAVKKIEMDDFLMSVDDLPNYYHFKSSVRRQMDYVVSEVQHYQEKIRDRINELEDHHIKKIYKKRKELYDSYLVSEEWRQKRQEVISIKGDCCFICGDKYDDIHHLHYQTLGDECPENDLEPVCRKCHKKIHGIDESEIENSNSGFWNIGL